jgi:ketosteroid isomerase-like protein
MKKIHFLGSALALAAVASLAACNKPEAAKPAADTGKISDAVKADVAQLVSDANAQDATKVTSHNAPDVVRMFHGQPNTVGAAANADGAKKAMATPDPAYKVTIADPVVDVAASGDMAVYRSTYVATFTDPKTKKPGTETGNYVAGYKLQPDGSWKIEWSVASDSPAAAPAAPAAKS